MTKDGFFKKYEYVYDEYYDCYICPADQGSYLVGQQIGMVTKEYKSDKSICTNCPYLPNARKVKNMRK